MVKDSMKDQQEFNERESIRDTAWRVVFFRSEQPISYGVEDVDSSIASSDFSEDLDDSSEEPGSSTWQGSVPTRKVVACVGRRKKKNSNQKAEAFVATLTTPKTRRRWK
mmetsp:Transcript_3642/g.10025  ORF Transcript_3642/g.10025 Transcript_3642/m.10025 type:complete len:109 (+) Transcript_3642:228-554(+)